MKSVSALGLLTALVVSTHCYSQDKYPSFEHRYFGQTAPGLTAQVFAPEFIATAHDYEGVVTYSLDMTKIYFVKQGGKYSQNTPLMMKFDGKDWGKPVVTDIIHPHFSQDGQKLYRRNTYRTRTSTGWSAPQDLGYFVKDHSIVGISVAASGTLYFDIFQMEGNSYISYSRQVNGKYQKPTKMGAQINTGQWIAHPFVAPDESYLMWDADTANSYGDHDLYISFRQPDGSWGQAINLGEQINTSAHESNPSVTPDGKFLTFWRGGEKSTKDGSTRWLGSPYWVDIRVIDKFRPK